MVFSDIWYSLGREARHPNDHVCEIRLDIFEAYGDL